jgi:hypothetical protein
MAGWLTKNAQIKASYVPVQVATASVLVVVACGRAGMMVGGGAGDEG